MHAAAGVPWVLYIRTQAALVVDLEKKEGRLDHPIVRELGDAVELTLQRAHCLLCRAIDAHPQAESLQAHVGAGEDRTEDVVPTVSARFTDELYAIQAIRPLVHFLVP